MEDPRAVLGGLVHTRFLFIYLQVNIKKKKNNVYIVTQGNLINDEYMLRVTPLPTELQKVGI